MIARALALGCAGLFAAGLAAADCLEIRSYVIDLELTGCRPAELAIEEQVAGTRVWWLRPYVLSIAETNPGVLLRGRVLRRRIFEIPRTLGPWREDGNEEEYLYPSSDGSLCEAFAGVEDGLFLAEPPCCEVIPPGSVACLLQKDELRPLTPTLLDEIDDLHDEEGDVGFADEDGWLPRSEP